jgi:glycosyltransferase involved in cell wall biosynthesis
VNLLHGQRDFSPTVLVYRSNLLPFSETFIREQLQSYRNWRGILIGQKLVHQLDLEGLDVRLVGNGMNRADFLVQEARKYLGLSGLWRALLRDRPSLLHAHFGTDAISAAPIAELLRIPLIVTLHGYDINIRPQWWKSGNGGTSMRQYPHALLKLAARLDVHFIAVSDAVQQQAILYGIPAQKITTQYIGVDVSRIQPGPVPIHKRSPRILFVGRLVEKKGCEYLLKAAKTVKARIPNLELVIVGDGPLRAGLEHLSHELDVGALFTGALAAADVKVELDRAQLLCLPSIHARNGDAEGFGLVLLEAQAAGVPVISSAMGGAEEGLIHGITGYQVEEGGIDALADGIIEILSNPHKAAAMGKAGRDFVSSRFDIHHCTQSLENLYDRIAKPSIIDHAAARA